MRPFLSTYISPEMRDFGPMTGMDFGMALIPGGILLPFDRLQDLQRI